MILAGVAMPESDRDYVARRIAEESEAARRSSCKIAQGAHQRLAELYSERLDQMLNNPARLVHSRSGTTPASQPDVPESGSHQMSR